MSTPKVKNIALKEVRKFLEMMGAKHIRTSGGHEIWAHRDLNRPIPLQTHIDPVPEFIVLEILNHFKVSKKKMLEMVKPQKGTDERKSPKAKRGKRSE